MARASDALPAVGWQSQRQAAARNETAILDAARKLVAAGGGDRIDVRQIAAEAGVGVGTIYRRFGDKAGVLAALVGEDERVLQDALIGGDPPLGPGAPAPERLEAFLRALCRLTADHADSLAAAQATAADGRYAFGSYEAWRLHARVLIADIDPRLDADWLADLVIAPLSPALYRRQRDQRGMTPSRIEANVVDCARRVTRI
ncbi:MAG: Transcriptional regulator, AcrR family [uncultured Blastococcus sp.]|uniref:Transcriptional regulator, AcrR family n=1 Tax=uncultured Blastococcus sp. TaxID=217144 RepID=A0A6J4JMP0_9ACTN|nr:MAG: Transcriptional regulator, AcrR family [uncultured Blastococcus sp.]